MAAIASVLFDVENQDQAPVNDAFAVICDTTVYECTEMKEVFDRVMESDYGTEAKDRMV